MEKTEIEELIESGVNEISPDESVIWKPLRKFFEKGNPTDRTTVLQYALPDGKRYPFCSMALSEGNRLIFWPPSNAEIPGEFSDGSKFPIHHVTLEVVNGTSHYTRFKPNGKREQDSRGWKLQERAEGLKLWLVVATRIDELRKQAGALEQEIKMPTTDRERRIEEFKSYMGSLQFVAVNTPAPRGDCLTSALYLLPEDSKFKGPVELGHFPIADVGSIVDCWPNGDQFAIVPTQFVVGNMRMIVMTVAPPGSLKGTSFIGAVTAT